MLSTLNLSGLGPGYKNGPASPNPPSPGYLGTEQKRTVNPPCPTFVPNYRTLYLSAQHRIQINGGRKRVSSALSRRPVPTDSRAVRRRRRKSVAISSVGTDILMSDDDAKSCTTVCSDVTMLGDHMKETDDTVFEDEEEASVSPLEKEIRCQKAYRNACHVLKIPIASTYLKGLATSEIFMRNHVIGVKGAKACAVGLMDNGSVESLNLQGNDLGPKGAGYICDILHDNIFLTDLNLAENGLGTAGLLKVMDLLHVNNTIKKVNLSGNGLREDDAQYIADMLRDNVTLEELDLSYNELRERGGKILGEALVDNMCLETLNLSWNHLRRKGAEAIAAGIQRNISLKRIDLSWNGFHFEGCRALGKALSINNTLEHLDLTCNRITVECLEPLLKGLRKNGCLKHLLLERNPITNEGGLAILDFLDRYTTSSLVYISIAGQDVNRNFQKRLREVLSARPDLEVVYGLTMQHDQLKLIQEESVFLCEDPMMILMEYMRIKNLRLVDLFNVLDQDKSNSLSKEEFKLGLMKANLPLSEKMLDRLISKLDSDNNGEVEFLELVEGQKEHRRKVLRLLNRTVENDIPFERTEIGRVSEKIRSLMRVTEHFWSNKIRRMAEKVDNRPQPKSGASSSSAKSAVANIPIFKTVSGNSTDVTATSIKQEISKGLEKRPVENGGPPQKLLQNRMTNLITIR